MRSLTICILFCVITSVSAQPDTDSTLHYEYLVYSSPEHAQAEVLFQKFEYHKRMNQYAKALQTIMRINTNSLPDTFIARIWQQAAFCNYMRGQHGDADYFLTRLEHEIGDRSFFEAYFWLKVICLNEMQRWTEAAAYLKKFGASYGLSEKWVDSLYHKALKYKPVSLRKTEALSTFLPGTGQMYAGQFWHGALNSTIILGCLGWGTYNVINGFYITGVFTGYLLAYTFYTGGTRYALDLAVRTNKNRVKRINAALALYITEAAIKNAAVQ